MNSKKILSMLMVGATVTSLMAGSVSAYAADNTETTEAASSETTEPLTIAEQRIFSAGGITITSDGTFNPEDQWEETGAGQTSHVDHANVLYQIPEEETSLPMVFLHGYGQSRMGWMTTPDGREGWAEMFLRDGHSVYLVDEPRRGEAGQTSVSGTISTKTLDQRWYTQFRIGRWEDGKSVPNEGLFASAQDCRRPVSPPPFLPEYTHHAPAQYAEAPLWSVRKKNLPAGSMLQRILSYVSMLYNALDLIIGQPPV